MQNDATTNPNSNLDAQDSMHQFAHIAPDEMPYEGAGFPGCGDGSDDLADANANEADDYRDEGPEDSHLDCQWEDQHEMGMMGDF